MLSEMREQVIVFMEHNEILSKLKGDKWYKMEDELVELCERVSGKKDNTYKNIKEIVNDWVGNVANEDEINGFTFDVERLGARHFGDIIPLVNQYFGWANTDGEIDGLAMELEEYYNFKVV